MQTDEVELVRLYAIDRQWTEVTGGYERALLYSNKRTSVWIERVKPGGRVPQRSMPGGEEVFVLNGTLQLLEPDRPVLEAWSWLRQPGAQHSEFFSETGALWWVKRGHLP